MRLFCCPAGCIALASSALWYQQAVLAYVQKRRSGNLLGNTPSPFNSCICPKQGENKAHSGKMYPQKQQIKPRQNRIYRRFIVAFLVVGVARLELAASCSQSRRATNCATPRHPAAQLHRRNIVYRFLRGSSIRNPQLTALHGPLFSAGRSGSRHFLWQLGAGLVQLTKSGCKN